MEGHGVPNLIAEWTGEVTLATVAYCFDLSDGKTQEAVHFMSGDDCNLHTSTSVRA